jgi:hypothetical protein
VENIGPASVGESRSCLSGWEISWESRSCLSGLGDKWGIQVLSLWTGRYVGNQGDVYLDCEVSGKSRCHLSSLGGLWGIMMLSFWDTCGDTRCCLDWEISGR